ncbi:IS3 family transposase [Pseudomonas juntendi]|uniref:IS3 family transposase n=1 Tax=Pseudomonas juntendi TaxID=2666183 RepID=A0A7W2M1Q4_9PSED|nr:IS3 family transposase [Pseudomonas juntendi]MBA6151082.1 IS3 family transposase [Pseudomonas juntendi]
MSKYTRQFKLSAIQAFLQRGIGYRFIAAQFQMDPSLLRRWVQAYRIHGEASLSRHAQTFSPEFKLSVLERKWRDKLSLRETAAVFNLTHSSQIGIWEAQYYSGGIKALIAGNKGPRNVMIKPSTPPASTSPKSEEELSYAELLAKLRHAEMEIAYLKKKRTARGEGETEEGREEKVLIISALRTRFPLDGLLKLAGLARSTYYYQRKLMAAGDKLTALKDRIREIQQRHKGRYGYRRMTATLHSVGHAVNSKVVRRLMAELDLKCTVRVKKYKSYRGEPGRIAPNKMERKFTAEEPNRRWVTDVTEFKVAGEKLYLSPVLDLFNGEIVAHQIDTSPHYPLVGQMLEQALSRLPEGARPMLHSDQGWQYQYYRYRNRLEEMGLEQSMSRKGNCLDNARMESFFGTLKTEMYHGQRFARIEDLSAAIDEYIDYYNHDRIKMGLAGLSPVAYRNQAAAA